MNITSIGEDCDECEAKDVIVVRFSADGEAQ